MNRKERRAGLAIHRSEIKQAIKKDHWGEWEDITHAAHEKLQENPESHRIDRYLKNNLYTAQVLRCSKGFLLGIRRHDQSTDIPWSHKFRIKNEVVGKGIQAIEIYPPVEKLVDSANMYWLWVLSEPLQGCDLKEALRGIYG